MRNIKKWVLWSSSKFSVLLGTTMNFFERSGLSGETPSQVKWLVWNEPSLVKHEEPKPACGRYFYVRAEAQVARRKIFPSLTWDGDFQESSSSMQRWEKMNKSLFLVGLQEEHFLLISLSRHRTLPTGLALFLTIFLPLAALAEMWKKSWKLIPAIMQGQHVRLPMGLGFETEMDPTWCFWRFLTLKWEPIAKEKLEI